MKMQPKVPPRRFQVGNLVKFDMMDCGIIDLEPEEQVTFVTKAGAEYDVSCKDWGFYATPSLNGRLQQFGLRGVLIRNWGTGRYFILLVERGREAAFDTYCSDENLNVIAWLDNTAVLDSIASRLQTL